MFFATECWVATTSKPRERSRVFAGAFASVLTALLLLVAAIPSRAQVQKPLLWIEEDCQAFAVAPDGKIAFAVRHIKGVKKLILERDDIWVTDREGHRKKILEGDKFIPYTEKMSYAIQGLRWSPDSRRLTVEMEVQSMGADAATAGLSGKSIFLLDDNGSVITVASNEPKPAATPAASAPVKPSGFSSSDESSDSSGSGATARPSRPGFIDGVADATWLADGKTIAYLTGAGPFQINTIRPSDGKKSVLFEGKTFIAVAWDAPHNGAITVSSGLRGGETLIQLDLLHETLRDLATIPGYDNFLSISPSGKRVGFFYNGDVLEVRDIANPNKPIDVRAGAGKFEWSKDERRVLLKRGPDKRSNNLVWITLPGGDFHAFMHDILFHDFEIMPDGDTIAILEPGKRTLKLFRLE